MAIQKTVGWARKGTHVAEGNVLDEGRVEVAPLPHLLEQGVDHVLEAGVLEAALPRLGQRRPDGECDDDVVGILRGAVAKYVKKKAFPVRCEGRKCARETYIWLSALPGDRCLRMEPSRSTAIVAEWEREWDGRGQE